MDITERPSPNHNDRRGLPLDMLVLHYTGMQTGAAAIERLCDPTAQVSAHYVVEEDGRLWRLVPDERRAWHAGKSFWAGESDINARSIGVEIVNPGHEWGYRDFPPAQVAAVILLCQALVRRHAIPAARVVGHSDVAPLRKQDPGERFPWRQLAVAGVGVFPPTLAPIEPVMSRATADLGRFGYGYLDEDPARVLRAVQRRFRPARLDGQLDGETAAIARWLAAQVDKDRAEA